VGAISAAGSGARGRRGCDHGLAAAHVALHQAHHRPAALEVGGHLLEHARLRAGQRPGQRGDELRGEPCLVGERQGRLGVDLALDLGEGELVRQQFLEGQPALRGMAAGGQRLQRGAHRRVVHELQRLAQGGEPELLHHMRGQQVLGGIGGEPRQRAVHGGAHTALALALGEGVHRRQPVLQRPGGAGASVLRMHHLQPLRAAAHLAEAAQLRAAREAFLLGAREVEEAQRQEARAVGDAHQQRAAAAEHHVGELHLALDHGARAGHQRADGGDPRAVLVAVRQQEQRIGARGGRVRYRASTHSTSTRAPRGSAATCTAARAGYGWLK
jgi:hypothetical protein